MKVNLVQIVSWRTLDRDASADPGRDDYAGGSAAAPSVFFHVAGGGARIALHIGLFPALLSCEGVFSGVVDSLVQENFLEADPQTLTLIDITQPRDQYTKHRPSRRSLNKVLN